MKASRQLVSTRRVTDEPEPLESDRPYIAHTHTQTPAPKYNPFHLSLRWKLIGGLAAFAIVGSLGIALYSMFQDTDVSWESCNSQLKIDPLIRIQDCGSVILSGKESGRSLASAHINRAKAFSEIGEITSSLADYNAALALEADSTLYAARGALQLRNGEPRKAIADFNSALALDANALEAITGRGNAFLTLGEPSSALKDFSTAIALDPIVPDPVYRRAIANARLDRIADALADYDKALELDPKNANYWNGRCWFRATMGVDLDLALTDCDQALQIKPDFVAALDSRAFVLLRLTRLEDALTAYDAAILKEPNHAWPYFGRAIVKKRLGDMEGASTDKARAQQIQPGIEKEYLKFGEEP